MNVVASELYLKKTHKLSTQLVMFFIKKLDFFFIEKRIYAILNLEDFEQEGAIIFQTCMT